MAEPAVKTDSTGIIDERERARAEVDRLAQLEAIFFAEHRKKAAAVVELEESASRQLVDVALAGDGSPHSKAGEGIAAARADADTLLGAIDDVRRRRLVAIPAVWKAQAASWRREASELRSQGERLQKESDRLRRALEAHDGCSYQPWRPLPGMGNGAPGRPAIVTVPLPKHALLFDQAQSLEVNASNIEQQRVNQSGGAEATSLEQLVAAIMAEPMRMGPSLVELASWFDQATARELARRSRVTVEYADNYVPPDAPIAYSVTWRNAALIPVESRAFTPASSVPELATVNEAALRPV